ncbi:hypothetical protein MOE82_03565 [Bacillus licheniformis]|uniref:hypothetical protein n=1 Tax=Bacillus licheniformis TaxID=1402 RepID=UPI00227DEC46|nr:hypothetical protein [Bacillus licheniformis]MCY9349846.1 hypothetical protein [Bacillus licheniformis]
MIAIWIEIVSNILNNISEIIYNQIPPILRLLIPLTLTIYLFNYKERKEVTTSYLKQKKLTSKTIISLGLTGALLLMFALHFYWDIDSSFITIIVCISWALSLMYTYIELFNLVNIFNVINQNIDILYNLNEKIKKMNYKQNKHLTLIHEYGMNESERRHYVTLLKIYWGDLTEKIRKKKLKKNYLQLDITIQIVTQLLLSKSKHNLNKDTTNYLKQTLETLQHFIEENIYNNQVENVLTLNLCEESLNIYTSILENSTLLLETSLRSNRYEDQSMLINFLKELNIGPPYIRASTYVRYESKNLISLDQAKKYLLDIQKSYLKNIKSVTTILHSHGYNGDLTMLRNLNLISNQGIEETSMVPSPNHIFTLQATILVDAVMKNNIKLLTDIVNITLEKSDFPTDKLNVFNLSVIKSIEQGHYSCAGHLIKMIVKKFEGDDIIHSLKEIYKHYEKKDSFSEVDVFNLCSELDNGLGQEFMLNMPFSPISFKYCFSKLVYLLEIQYNYKNSEDLKWYNEFEFEEPIEYIQQKVLNLYKEYGLIVLKEDLLLPKKQTV